MAIISDTTKIDRSFKFASGKAYTTSNKGVDNEDAPSGFIVGTSSIFSQDAGIPTTAPGVSTSILTFYGDGTSMPRFKMTYDISSPLNKAWYASTDGSTLALMRSTRQGNWVPPTFGNYTIRIFLTFGSGTTTPYVQEIFFSDATSPLFDYKAGILTFESNPIAAYPGTDGIQIGGYRYTGLLLSQIFDGNGNYTGGLSDLSTSTSIAKFVDSSKIFNVSSPLAIGSSFVEESIPGYGTAPQWKSIFQLTNGQIVAVGNNSGNTVSYTGYGFGQEATNGYTTWFTSGAGLSSLTQILGIWSPNDKDAYAVGAGGTQIGRSFDGGVTWATITSPGIGTIKAIWGSSLSDIFILGSSPNGGAISHATNGVTYTAQTSGTTNNLVSIWGSSSSDIYAVGDSGTIRHSTGIGTWTNAVIVGGTANDLKSIFGLSSTAVYAVGSNGTVMSSHVYGTWVTETGLPGTFFATGVWGILAGTTTKLYICGNTNSGAGPGAVYTSDGSGTWVLHTTFGAGQLAYSIYGGTNGIYVGSNNAKIEVLHQNPVLLTDGNTVVDGYLSVGLSLKAQYAALGSINSGPITANGTPTTAAIVATGGSSGSNYNAIIASCPSGFGIGITSTATGIATAGRFTGGDLAGVIGIETSTSTLRDSIGSSAVQKWYGTNNSGQQTVGTLDSFGTFAIAGHIDMKEIPATTLNGAITSGVTTIPVFSVDGFPITDLTGFAVADTIRIDSELISYFGISISPPQFLSCTRGVNGTAASNHLNGAVVQYSPTTAAAHGKLYFKSNGIIGTGHRTQLAVKWPDGSETIIAESPAT